VEPPASLRLAAHPDELSAATGMIPDDVTPEAQSRLLDPSIMGPPIVWLCSDQADGVHDQRVVATQFER